MSEPPRFVYRIRPTRRGMLAEGPTKAEAAVIDRHFAYLQRLVGEGVVLLAGRTLTTDASSFGIVILAATDAERAQQIMSRDPAVAEGVMHAELAPFRIALVSDRIAG